ncbi:BrnT family toxin [Polaromonas sp. DSP2-3-2b2]|uniref:BrnT family toxin n=1 Tax=Polaromonas sp. DSP2-3-2b2 TaxID=2804662 RepID=UPI003CE79DCC
MQIEFDPAKQQNTLRARGLDFARAAEVFAGSHLTRQDERQAYTETRYQTVGWLDGRLVMTVWTPRGAARRIISMRKINERETQAIGARLD